MNNVTHSEWFYLGMMWFFLMATIGFFVMSHSRYVVTRHHNWVALTMAVLSLLAYF